METLILAGIAFLVFIIYKVNNIYTEKEYLQKSYSQKISQYNQIEEKYYDSKNEAEKLSNELTNIKKKYNDKSNELHNEIRKLKQEIITVREKIENDIQKVLYEKSQSQKWLAGMIADFLTLEDEYMARFLENKTHPAYKKAKEIRDIRIEKKELIEKIKMFEYQFEYLKSLFPDISEYLENPDIFIEDENDIEIDPVKKYISQEEFESLTEIERNQKALDNYWQKKKTKWQIGRDFERYVGYLYEAQGFNVQYFGIEKKLEDLGRDLITENNNEIHLIQCKYWASEKRIREKHIFQLFGTTIMFMMKNPENNKKVIPVFYSHCPLSEEAKEYSKYLNVLVFENIEINKYPMIKCNIGHGKDGFKQKIYHLPMDQQYDKTKIDNKKGDFYCLTVEEAVNKGFRRAYKWYSYNT